MNLCENCGREKLTMIYKGERWCCDNCRKALLTQEALAELAKPFPGETRIVDDVQLRSYGPTEHPLLGLHVHWHPKPYDVTHPGGEGDT
jgi:hypothetical protein